MPENKLKTMCFFFKLKLHKTLIQYCLFGSKPYSLTFYEVAHLFNYFLLSSLVCHCESG